MDKKRIFQELEEDYRQTHKKSKEIFNKVCGIQIRGGMPVSAVAGKDEAMALPSPAAPPQQMVKFDGGTFSIHPASMLAGLVFIKYLIAHENEIYPKIGRWGSRVRKEIERIFNDQGICVRSTGDRNPVTENSSMVGVHFLIKEQGQITCPEQAWNPDISDVELREKIFKLAMINEGKFPSQDFFSLIWKILQPHGGAAKQRREDL
jgi:glutamate-1-semialdehyde 2,1-aminomutase